MTAPRFLNLETVRKEPQGAGLQQLQILRMCALFATADRLRWHTGDGEERDMAKKPTASDFLKPLGRKNAALVFTGLVRAIDGDETAVSFSRSMDCSRWTRIPVDLIESLESFQTVRCGEHSHPLVRMTLKEPTSDEAKVFAALAEPEFSGPQAWAAPPASLRGALPGAPPVLAMNSILTGGPENANFGLRLSPQRLECGWVWDVGVGAYVYRCI